MFVGYLVGYLRWPSDGLDRLAGTNTQAQNQLISEGQNKLQIVLKLDAQSAVKRV